MHLRMFIFYLYFIFPVIYGGVIHMQNRDWMGNPSADFIEGDVECFSEYMELWVHRLRTEGLRLWLSAMLRIQVTLRSLEIINQQLSACGLSLHKDLDRNYIFRVMYSGCFVQLEHGHYVIVLNLMKRISRFGGRTHNYVMKCPVVPAPPNTEHIQCDSDFIQVTRQIPVDSWNNELRWSLALRGSLVVALEDSSLIQVNVDINKPLITVQGRRSAVLSPVQVLQTEGLFLPLKLVCGKYAYSMEATCPNMIQPSSESTVLHIYKRRMGLTKRGGYDDETLSVSSVSINQTDTFTWSESTSFVKLIVPTALIQKTKTCVSKDGENLQQSFFRIDVVLNFKETNHRMLWTMENTSPCSNEHISSEKTHPSVTPKSPVAFTPLDITLNSVTEESKLSFHTESRTSSGTSKTSSIFQDTSLMPGVASGFPWSNGSLDSDTRNVFRTTSYKADSSTDNINPDIHGNPVVKSVSMDLDTTPISLSNPSLSTLPEQFMDLINAREMTTLMPSLSTPDNTVRLNTNSKINTAVLFTTSPSEAETKWNPLYFKNTNTNIILNTVPHITSNTPPATLTPMEIHHFSQPLQSSLQPDITLHSAVPNKTTIIHTTHKGQSVNTETITVLKV